jgi:hypothetical protein
MARYYEQYFAGDTLDPISEEDARATGTYAEHVVDADAPEHFRSYFRHALSHVIYPDRAPDAVVNDFQRRRYGEVEHWIVSSVARDASGTRYEIWYYQPGTEARRVTYWTAQDVSRRVEQTFAADGRLLGSLERRFNESGEQVEAVHRDAAGTVVSIDD